MIMKYRIFISEEHEIVGIVPHDSSITYDGNDYKVLIETLDSAKIYLDTLATVSGMPQIDTQPIIDYQNNL